MTTSLLTRIEATAPSASTSSATASAPIPKALNRLQESESLPNKERKFTPMDIDPASGPILGPGEILNSRGKIVFVGDGDGEGMGFCRPGDEDCG